MRLETIKMAGFKSFVDPTTLHLPTNLSGVVGPNGCGKSNIIDAVRWVMGESAASRLRGEALTDVIFAGSSARKPVGQATVELLFDNSDGTIEGEYASFNQISVKRSVSRDGQSRYFLNGSRCRRRDITDLFLGTGLGPRSYSIIEQGVISEIVEAHPDQLRAHLEEAAGISRYKERRKETEGRIKRARDNIERLTDVRDEVERQLEKLNRQARAAERWQELKQQLGRLQAERHAIDYRQASQELAGHASGLSQMQVEIERELAGQRHLEAELETRRNAREAVMTGFNKAQEQNYRIGADLARIEQQIQHENERRERLEREAGNAERQLAELERQQQTDQKRARELEAALAEGTPAGEALRASEERASAELDSHEKALLAWQQQWQEHNQTSAEATRAADQERTRIDYLDRKQADMGQRRQAIEKEQQDTDLQALEAAVAALGQQHVDATAEAERHEQQFGAHRTRHDQQLEQEHGLVDALAETRQKLSAARGRLASLEALQSAALGRDEDAVTRWLVDHGIDPDRRLGASLDVDDGWETAVETVLHGMLDGVLVEQPLAHADALAQAGEFAITLLQPDGTNSSPASGRLSQHVRGPAAVLAMLASVHCARDLDTARGLLGTLPAGDSVITADGLWLADGLVRVLRHGEHEGGVLAREREMQDLQAEATRLEAERDSLTQKLQDTREARQTAEKARDEARDLARQAHRLASELGGQLHSRQGRLDTARDRLGKLASELDSLSGQRQELEAENRTARGRLEEAVARMEACEQQRQALDSQRRGLLEAREEARGALREATERRQRHAIGMESSRSTLESLRQGIERTRQQIAQLQGRQDEVRQQLSTDEDPIEALNEARQSCLAQRLEADQQLVQARTALTEHDQQTRATEQRRSDAEQKVSQLRDKHAEARLSEQALRLRVEQLQQAISETGHEADTLLQDLENNADPAAWQERIETLQQRITRMEPVNLAAIQEREQEAERKHYIDVQLTDLNDALDTLESAIKKIDKEMRSRFKDTFEKVNAGLQDLFPRLFGGGHAHLELTEEDMLHAGVTIMVRPPGKRVSNISLLSGGEKAVTAVALVFAIFRLNPAPFCILDEVDAPMDEANVGRFNDMVVAMSDQVQFIVVTHNKNTMEAAQQLCGVTMREPGVSRLVLVDVAEAARLAGTS